MLDRTRLAAIARKEAIQLSRDRRSMTLAFMLPLFMLFFFGYAITWDVADIPLGVLDHDRTRQSRRLVEVFEASGYFEVTERLTRTDQIDERLASGGLRGVLVVPAGFERKLASGNGAEVQLLLDGGDANTATIALNYSDAIVARFSADVLLKGRRFEPLANSESRVWYNPTLESRNMIVPGLVAVIMSIIAAMLTALTIAREWERGTMEQLAATPVHRLEVILGKLAPYVVIGLIDVAAATAAGILIFEVPFRGDALLLAILTLLFLFGALGFGIFISAAVKSQVLAMQFAMITTYLPAILLSGFLFDVASMPVVLQAVTFVVPAKYFIAVTRGVFLKGVGLDALCIQALSMLVFATIGLGLAVAAFRKQIAQ